MDSTCGNCGNATKKGRKFCSHKCANVFSGPIRRRQVGIVCEFCKKTKEISQGQFKARMKAQGKIRFCSKKCEGAAKTASCAKQIECAWCKKVFITTKARIHRRFCGKDCQWKERRANPILLGMTPANYKGESASNVAKHLWVYYHFGRPKKCEKCGTEEKKWYDWANVSDEYKRERSDWMRLCRPCHRRYDYAKKKT